MGHAITMALLTVYLVLQAVACIHQIMEFRDMGDTPGATVSWIFLFVTVLLIVLAGMYL